MEKESLRARVRKRVRALRFNQKLSLFLTAAILATNLLILATATISAGATLTSQSSRLALKQIDSVSKSLQIILKDFNDVATLLISEDSILDYTRAEQEKTPGYISLGNRAVDSLIYIKNVKGDIDYISLVKDNDDTLRYFGGQWTGKDLLALTREDYAASTPTAYGNMTVSVAPQLFGKKGYSINFYQPVYDRFTLDKRTGLICISVRESTFQSYYRPADTDMPFNCYLADGAGRVLSHREEGAILSSVPWAGRLQGARGSFQYGGNLVVYSFLRDFGWYVVGEIPITYLLGDSVAIFVLLLAAVLLFCLLGVVVGRRLSNSLYRPLEEIVSHMSRVSAGDLHTRMGEYEGEDLKKLAGGFNQMVEEIETLIERIKTEQKQMQQIELNALQSQIKPHFLYNTLECIHWQAVVDGNKEISTLVKALATYYRICLSRGSDIIPLSQELSHVRSYLVIQNMRYGDIIEGDFEIPGAFAGLPIPKMTLQPLVENSIYHGIKVKEGCKGKVIIRARAQGDDVVVTVADSGTGMTAEKLEEINNSISVFDPAFGYGVRNVHKRIEILFGAGYGLHYEKNGMGGVTVRIRLPQGQTALPLGGKAAEGPQPPQGGAGGTAEGKEEHV